MKLLMGTTLIVSLAFATPPTFAQQAAHSQATVATASSSTAAYEASMAKMHKGMMLNYSGDPDIDFVRGMIPHHQGAADMAKVMLQYGKDPQMLKLAQQIVDDQDKEIGVLKEWLAKNDKK
jgi:uncharacterized protein (DUF305 family)